MSTRTTTRPETARVDLAAVATFLVVAFGAAWLITLPLWLSGRGLQTPGIPFLLVGMMAAPTLGTLAVTRLRPGTLRATGLPFRKAWLPWAALAWLAPLVIVALSLLLGAAVGVFHADLVGFSGFRELLHAAGADGVPLPLTALVLIQIAQILIVGWINVIPALGEEWGWRGWLLPALLPWGRWPAILAVGAIWGLWHAPILLLGYNYPLQPAPARLLLMVGFCVVLGSLLGWLRLRSGSVWPCAIGHGFVNAAAGLPLVLVAAGHPIDNATTGLLGWTGWLVMALALGLVALVTRRRARAADSARQASAIRTSPMGDQPSPGSSW